MEKTTFRIPQRNIFHFNYLDEHNNTHPVTFNSNFDSGNLLDIIPIAQHSFVLYTAPDCAGTPYSGNAKSWFYFSAKGFPPLTRVTFIIRRLSILWSMYKSAPDMYKPVYRINNGQWNRIEEKAYLSENSEDRILDLTFSFEFDGNPSNEYFFALIHPFSYEELANFLDEICDTHKNDKDIYLKKEIITKSEQNRPVYLLTISSHHGKLNETESFIDDKLFPNRAQETRAQKYYVNQKQRYINLILRRFRLNKPVVFLTGRVHPGETPASHAMNGIIKFLLNKEDLRARLLRNYFVFMIIPMINVDGVSNGHFRMNTFNENLNRFYKNPDPLKQPAIFAIRSVAEYLRNESRIFFYCDLHSHAVKKGCFLYGNALDFVMQTESMLFAKVLSINCPDLEYKNCNFSLKNMNSKDRGEKLTKEGAARVCMYKLCNIIHSYTLECGLHFTTIQPLEPNPETDDQTSSTATLKGAPMISSTNQSKSLSKTFVSTQSLGGGFRSSKNSNQESTTTMATKKVEDADKLEEPEQQHPLSPKYYTIESYENLGKAILVSILDIFEKNPLSLTTKVAPDGIKDLRKQIAGSLYKMNRFRKEGKLLSKFKQINQMVHKKFYEDFDKKKVFDKQLMNIKLNHSATINASLGLNKDDEGVKSFKTLAKTISVNESKSEHTTNRNPKGNRSRLRGKKYFEYANQTSEEEHEEGEYGQEEDDDEDEEEEEAEAGNRDESSQERYFSKKNKSPGHQTTDDELPVSKWVSEATSKMRLLKQSYKAENHQAMLALNDSQSNLKENSVFLPTALGNKRISDFKAEKPTGAAVEDTEFQDKRFTHALNKLAKKLNNPGFNHIASQKFKPIKDVVPETIGKAAEFFIAGYSSKAAVKQQKQTPFGEEKASAKGQNYPKKPEESKTLKLPEIKTEAQIAKKKSLVVINSRLNSNSKNFVEEDLNKQKKRGLTVNMEKTTKVFGS